MRPKYHGPQLSQIFEYLINFFYDLKTLKEKFFDAEAFKMDNGYNLWTQYKVFYVTSNKLCPVMALKKFDLGEIPEEKSLFQNYLSFFNPQKP